MRLARELSQTLNRDRHMGLFMREQLRVLPAKLGETEQLCLSCRLFVAVGETGNEIVRRALALCERSLSQSGTRPGAEYESLISRPHRAYGNEKGLIQRKPEFVATPGNVISAALFIALVLTQTCPVGYRSHVLYNSIYTVGTTVELKATFASESRTL